MSLPAFFASPRRSRPAPAALLYSIKVCAAVFALSVLAMPSYAGHWDIEPDDHQGKYVEYQSPLGIPVDDYEQINSFLFGEIDDYDVRWADAGTAERLTCHGTYNYVVTWIPDGTIENDPPPRTVILKETAKAWWGAYLWPGVLNLTRDVADNGWGDAAVFTDYSVYSNGFIIADKASQSSRILTYDGSSGVIHVNSPVLDVDVAEENSTTSDAVKLYAGGSFDVVEDHRYVEISSSIEQSYYKGVFDVPHGTDRDIHFRDPISGNIAVDSVAEWHSDLDVHNQTTGFVKGWQINGLPLTAAAAEFQVPSYAWSLSGLTQSQAWIQLPTTTPENPVSFYLREVDTNKFPLTSTVSVKVSDSDGISIKTDYGITWHLPREKNQLVSVTYTRKKHGAARVSDLTPSATGLKSAVPAEDIAMSAIFDAGAKVTAGLGDEKDAALIEIAAKFAELANVKFAYPGAKKDDTVQEGATNDDGTWGTALHDIDEKYVMVDGNNNPTNVPTNIYPETFKNDIANRQLCKMSWWVIEKDVNETWTADGYDQHGYDGNSNHPVSETHVEGMDEEPFFVQYKTPDGTLL